jgi:tryptophan-rich sensory protein
MSDEVIRSAATPFPVRALPWLVGAGVYALLLTLGPQLLNDPDSYSHIAVGRWIMAHGALLTSDPFSFSMHGAHWIPFEWLSEVIWAVVYGLSGWAGVVVLAAAAIALAFGLMTRFLLRELSPTPALLMVMVAVVLLAPHMLARPHVLTLPIMVAWAAALVRCMDRRAPPP